MSAAAQALITRIFEQIAKDGSGVLAPSEAASIFSRINARLGRDCGERHVADFFRALATNGDGLVDVEQFHAAFVSWLGF